MWRSKDRKCHDLGLHSEKIELPAETTQQELLEVIARLNADPAIHGILVQSPPPPQIDEAEVVLAIDPEKDVDGFHPQNVAKLALEDPTYEDIASKFFEHFVHIADAMNSLGGTGLWDEADGFYYDQLKSNGSSVPLGIRSIVGIIPLYAVEVLEEDAINRLPGFRKRMEWFLHHHR